VAWFKSQQALAHSTGKTDRLLKTHACAFPLLLLKFTKQTAPCTVVQAFFRFLHSCIVIWLTESAAVLLLYITWLAESNRQTDIPLLCLQSCQESHSHTFASLLLCVLCMCCPSLPGQDDVPGLQVKMASHKWVIAPTIPGDRANSAARGKARVLARHRRDCNWVACLVFTYHATGSRFTRVKPCAAYHPQSY
jgi:hypothetical protein